MRFIMIMHPDPKTAYASPPPVEAVEAMTRYNKELTDAGVLLDAEGLLGPDQGFRVRYPGGRPVVSDGPFAEAKEVIGGYWIIQVSSREEAVEWARRIPAPGEGDMVEVRRIAEMSDYPEDVQQAARG